MKKDEEITYSEPPNRLYYRRPDIRHRYVSPIPRGTINAIYINWSVLLESLNKLNLDNDSYWKVRKMISEIK